MNYQQNSNQNDQSGQSTSQDEQITSQYQQNTNQQEQQYQQNTNQQEQNTHQQGSFTKIQKIQIQTIQQQQVKPPIKLIQPLPNQGQQQLLGQLQQQQQGFKPINLPEIKPMQIMTFDNQNNQQRAFQEKQIEKLKEKIKKIEEENEELEKKNRDLKKENQNRITNTQMIRQQQTVEELEQENEELQEKINKLQQQLNNKTIQLNNKVKESDQINQQLLEENQDLQRQTELFRQSVDKGQQQQINQYMDEIAKKDKIIKDLKQQLFECQQEKLKIGESAISLNSQQEIKELTDKLADEQRYYQQRVQDIDKLRNEKAQLQNQLKIAEESQKSTLGMLQKRSNELTEIKQKFQYQEDEIQQLNKTIQDLKNLNNQMNQFLNNPQNDGEGKAELEKIKQMQLQFTSNEEIQQQKKLAKERQLEEQKQQQLLQQQMLKDKQAQQLLDQQQKKQEAKNLKNKWQESHGSLEVCFVIDVTGSMDPYKDMAMKSVKQCMKSIKEKTNRDTSFSTVCYQDFQEKKKLPDKQYQQLDLTKDTQKLENYLQSMKCHGGGDAAEDVAGGLQQMCDKISWKKPFRLAILICDAPAHGSLFNGDVMDSYAHLGNDLQKAIDSMIEKEIILVALNFNKVTVTMYNQMKAIYQQKKRSDLFLLSDLSGNAAANVLQEMIQKMSDAAVQATHTNKKETKSKNDKPTEQNKNKDGAIEALCKAGNFFDFDKDPKVKTVQSNFKVYSASLNDESFLRDISNLKRLKFPQDYQVQGEGSWNCIRTQSPFAFGMMKEVYLMKKANNAVQELYVIKTPLGGKTYESKEKAIEECRSHLICQSLMRMFMKDIRQACENKGKQMIYPTVIYTDFLILEENPNSFWIAERFFKGEFVKYNNNYGYISEDESILNQMAQAFSYYTYFKSNFNYMINDVQGVGTYFTDPAINTIEGKFDETDMGQDGQGMFMVSYDLRKGICAPIIKELLDIDDD